MANLYVRSSGGSDANNGSTWALAKATLAGVAAIDANGDAIWISQAHAESSASAQTIPFAGTVANPVRVICGDDSAEPPTSVATSAAVTTTGANGITITGNAFIFGILFNAGTGTGNVYITIASTFGNNIALEQCDFAINATNVGGRLQIGNNGGSAKLLNCSMSFGSTGQGVVPLGSTDIVGGNIKSGSAAITRFFKGAFNTQNCTVRDFDFSNCDSGLILVDAPVFTGRIDFYNCKLPASWSGSVVSAAPTIPAARVSMYNCDSSNTNYRLWVEDFAGSIKSETTLVKTGGASDGTTPISWKMTTNANANEALAPLVSDPIAIWNSTTGSSKTITVDVLHDSATNLTDAEIWLEIEYLGTSGYPLAVCASDQRATILTTAADQTASSATWTTTGMTNPNKQKLEVTFTPQVAGFVYARVFLAKASKTVYVDPQPVIS